MLRRCVAAALVIDMGLSFKVLVDFGWVVETARIE
jgi:hypothetical protein